MQGLEEVAFSSGRIVISRGAQALREQGLDVHYLLQRHFLGDDGGVSDRDRAANIAGRQDGGRVFSTYSISMKGVMEGGELHIWIITEGDRSYTTVLLPSEY